MLVMMAINLYTSRIVLRELGDTNYGLYTIVGGIVIFLGFLNTSMAAASQRFLSYANGLQDKLNATFNSIFIVQSFISLVIFLLCETIGVYYVEYILNVDEGLRTTAHIIFQISTFTFIIKTITVPYNASIIANEKMNVFAIFSIFEAFMLLGVAYMIQLFQDNKIICYATMILIVTAITQIGYCIYCTKSFKECKLSSTWERPLIKSILSYSGWNLFGALSNVAIHQGSGMVINSFFGVSINAATGISSQVNNAAVNLSRNFQQALNPQIVKTYAKKEFENMHKLILRGCRYSFFLLLCITVPLIVYINPILKLWLTNVPNYTAQFCILTLCNSLIGTLSGPILTGAMATDNIKKYQIVVASINLLNIPISILVLTYLPNPMNTMYIMIGLSILALNARLYMTKQMIGFPVLRFYKEVVLPISFTALTAITSSYAISNLIEGITVGLLFIQVFISILITLLTVATIGINKKEKKCLLSMLKRKLVKR